jgi:hypothetical protein
MSVPMRKDNFDDEDLTTADLAQGKRPVNLLKDEPTRNDERAGDVRDRDVPAVEGRPGPVLAERHPSGSTKEIVSDGRAASKSNEGRDSADKRDSDTAPLFPNNELEELRNRWNGLQTAFVDEPRRAVEQADGLVASAMKRLAEVFAEERSKLEHQWDRGDNVSTEDLRIALQRYRSFFQRLLSI